MAFKAGESGNPAGRKKGTNPIGRTRAAIMKIVPEIIENLHRQALAGDTAAAKLPLERTIPPLKPVQIAVQLPINADGTWLEVGKEVLRLVAAGTLPIDDSTNLLSSMSAMATLEDKDSIRARLEALDREREAAIGKLPR